MKKTTLLALLLSLVCIAAMGQNIHDPSDRIYQYLTLWFEKGYIAKLPIIRPYPIQIIVPMLKDVRSKGTGLDAEIAGSYIKQLNGDADRGSFKPENILPQVHIGLLHDMIVNGQDYYGSTQGEGTGNALVTDSFSYSGLLRLSMIKPPKAGFVPLYSRVLDESKSGGGGLGTFTMGQLSQFGMFLGNDFLYLQAGLMRTAFGPNYRSSPVVSPEASAAAHVSLTCDAGWIGFSTLFLDLQAAEFVEPSSNLKKYYTVDDLPVLKYLVVQTLHLNPFDFAEVGIVQTVLAGGTFRLFYLMPFPIQNLFYSQQLAGDRDSSFVGLYARFRFPLGIAFNTTFYVDDWDSFGAAGQAQGALINFNSAQDKFALQAALSWSPDFPVFRRIGLEYLMITPYTYTHNRFDSLTWLMYTNDGEKLGPNLEPNSDQISLYADFQPWAFLNIGLSGRFIRHGNASDGIPNMTAADGSIYDDGFDASQVATFVGAPSRFLTQSLLEYTLQAGIDTETILPFDWGTLLLDVGYLFEYVWNRDLVAGRDEMYSYLHLKVGYRF
jgi:hypothetical protein